jgi:hypothetical protein
MAGDELLKPTLHVEVLLTAATATLQSSREVRETTLLRFIPTSLTDAEYMRRSQSTASRRL